VKLNIPATTETVFRIGSLSKQFVATAIMMLVQEGKLSLDDPISKYVDGTPNEWKEVTLRHLLTHSSGIPDFLNENIPFHTWRFGFDERVLKAVAHRPLHFAPGEEWRYSNTNYLLLAMVIRKITGEPYGDFFGKRIFQPLGMTHTTVSPISGNAPGLSAGYEWDNNHLQPGYYEAPSIKAYAGGGLLSTVFDMAKWDAALYTEKLLKQSSLELMWTPVRLNDGSNWRYGFGIGTSGRFGQEHLILSHQGNITGFSSAMERIVDEQLTVVVLDNLFNSSDAAMVLVQKIARVYLWTGPDYPPIPNKEPEITAQLKAISDRAMLGTSRKVDFTAAGWAEWSPWQRQSQQDGARLGKAVSFVLVQRGQNGDQRSYRYRARWNFGTCLFHIVLDEQNRIVAWTTEDVDLN
jgi:CubicO group peptidase (beta-lactamase class C family)